MNEGLAEYTGMMVGRQKDSIILHLLHVLSKASAHKSFIRYSPYITGPLYGYLLYEQNPDWTLKIDSNANFPVLIENNYHIKISAEDLKKNMSARIDHFDGKAIINSEKLKEVEHRKIYDKYMLRFTKQPALIIKLIKMKISFDPNNLFDLGDRGTIYPTVEIRDIWGHLEVFDNGALLKDWKVITIPVSEGIINNGQVIEGLGWKITLNAGWAMEKKDPLHFELVKKNKKL